MWPLACLLTLFFMAFNVLEATQPSVVSRVAPPHAKEHGLGIYNTLQSIGCSWAEPWVAGWSSVVGAFGGAASARWWPGGGCG